MPIPRRRARPFATAGALTRSEASSGFGVGPGRRPKGRRPFATSKLRRIFELVGAAEAAAEFTVSDEDHGGATAGAGVGQVAAVEIVDEALDLWAPEVLVGIDRAMADRPEDFLVVEVAAGACGAGALDVGDHFADEGWGLTRMDEGGHGLDLEGVASEILDVEAGGAELAREASQEGRLARAEFEGLRGKELLAGDGAAEALAQQIFE